MAEARQYLAANFGNQTPYDLVCCGVNPGSDPARCVETTRRYAENGATWWLECIAPFPYGGNFEKPWPIDAMINRVKQGPEGNYR